MSDRAEKQVDVLETFKQISRHLQDALLKKVIKICSHGDRDDGKKKEVTSDELRLFITMFKVLMDADPAGRALRRGIKQKEEGEEADDSDAVEAIVEKALYYITKSQGEKLIKHSEEVMRDD